MMLLEEEGEKDPSKEFYYEYELREIDSDSRKKEQPFLTGKEYKKEIKDQDNLLRIIIKIKSFKTNSF